MKFSKKFLPIVFIAIALILATYKLLSDAPYTSSVFKKTEYEISIPHYGPLILTQEIDVTFTGNVATGYLPQSDMDQITKNKKVILFDKQGYALPLGGEVRSIRPQENDTSKIVILIPKGTQTELLNDKLSIIKREEIGTKRLPNYVLQRSEDGNFYVWRATQEADNATFKIKKTPIKILLRNEKYFVEAGRQIGSRDYVVINPDNALSEEKSYNFKIVDFNAPLHNPIKQAWIDLKLKNDREQQAILIQAAEDCANGVAKQDSIDINDVKTGDSSSADGSGSSSSCGSPFQGTDPFLIFQNMINEHGHEH